jgi:hypothetical protein
MPSYKLVLNNTNVVGNYNTQLVYNFISGTFHIPEGSRMCLSSLTLPYSWFNINGALYRNNSFSYIWYYGNGTAKTYTVTIPNGFYELADIQNYLELYMISQNQYFTNTTTGQNLYYVSFSTNTTYYAIQLICSPIPSTLPSGFTAPSAGFNGTDGYPTAGYNYTPRVIIASNNNFGSLIGFSAGTYPSAVTQSTNNSLGSLTPNLTPVNSLILLCNLVSNDVSSQGNIFTSIPISNTSFGSNLNYNPNFQNWITVNPGSYSSFTISILDQNFNYIEARDSNMLITLTMEVPERPVFTPQIEKKILSISNLYNQ